MCDQLVGDCHYDICLRLVMSFFLFQGQNVYIQMIVNYVIKCSRDVKGEEIFVRYPLSCMSQQVQNSDSLRLLIRKGIKIQEQRAKRKVQKR